MAYGGQDGGQASQNSTLQNSLTVKFCDHSGLLRGNFRFSGVVFAQLYRRMTKQF
jgi:hypothetical protein